MYQIPDHIMELASVCEALYRLTSQELLMNTQFLGFSEFCQMHALQCSPRFAVYDLNFNVVVTGM